MKKVVISDYYYENLEAERSILEACGCRIDDYRTSSEDELIARAADCDALIVQFAPVTRRVIENLKHCKVIVRYAIGVDNIDLNAADEAGIAVCNVPDYCIDEVSTHAVLLLLAAARKLPLIQASVANGRWDYQDVKPLRALSQSTVGLIGFGAIARQVAEKLAGFHPAICAYDPYADPARAEAMGVKLVDLDTLLRTSDFISIHCPLTGDTRQMLNDEAFARMKPGVGLVSTARGGIIDETALCRALDCGTVSTAALDVLCREPAEPSNPLLHDSRVLITPHISWYSEASIRKLQRSVAEEVRRVLTGEAPKHMVNHPAGNGG